MFGRKRRSVDDATQSAMSFPTSWRRSPHLREPAKLLGDVGHVATGAAKTESGAAGAFLHA